MSIITADYLDKLYGGWLGKIIGVRHGAFIEGMTYEKIRESYGIISGYPHIYKHFAADDDTNVPTFLIRALTDYRCSEDVPAEEIGHTWLNYSPFEHGFYWWGGYGISTEHTAYLNLRAGVRAPLSGSIEQNGTTLAEQIGGQIFIDCWGLVAPGKPDLAAKLAEKAASVSHDGNGKWGGVFIATCISLAFLSDNLLEIIEQARQKIPKNLIIYKVIGEVIAFHKYNPDDWEACFAWIKANHGYDRYPGICHIVPNLAVVILALLYGNGDFSDTINICSMCGWDTDCNSGNAGTILGVMTGSKRIPRYWTEPINDQYVCSSVMGSMNIVDVPSFVYYLAALACRLQNEEVPASINNRIADNGLTFDFSLPGSRHGITVQTSNGCAPVIQNDCGSGTGLLLSGWAERKGDRADCSFNTYYTAKDFDDNRSNPAFSPTVYPGAEITAKLETAKRSLSGPSDPIDPSSSSDRKDPSDPSDVYGNIFIKTLNGRTCSGDCIRIGDAGKPSTLKFRIPPMESDAVISIGLSLRNEKDITDQTACPQILLLSISTGERPSYSIDFSHMKKQMWTAEHIEIDQFTRLKGSWDLLDGKLSGSCHDFGEIYTGHYLWSDYSVSATVRPVVTVSAGLNCRVQGAVRSYALVLADCGRIAFLKNSSDGYITLREKPFQWEYGCGYKLRIDATGNTFRCYCDDRFVFEVVDDEPFLTGCVGFSLQGCGRCEFEDLSIK